MVANLGNEGPSVVRRGAAGRRRRRRRESALVWWALFAALAGAAAWRASWRLALLALLLWCLYEFLLVPTICRVLTRQGYACREPVRGRLFACRVEHQSVKGDALWRLVGRRRRRPPSDPNRDTGVVVYSPKLRGRLARTDLLLVVLAGAGTVVLVAGAVYGLT
ncbi:hypothetical protein [Actinomadura flavalba]|uniref:hypothetical protein n=1 Tax=Actinomadura flavalba TaxID=1120938 RepID=UPI00037260C0|nr:hypothetical protein [Actinomadura flavalba]